MRYITEFLKRKSTSFCVDIPKGIDARLWIESELLKSPYAVSTIKSLSFQTYSTSNNRRVQMTVSYLPEDGKRFVFCVKNSFELTTAISVSLKLHLEKTVIIIDDRDAFVDKAQLSTLVKSCREFVGEELQLHQFSASQSSWMSFFNGRIISYSMKISYFDTSKDINDLECLLAEQAILIRVRASNNPGKIVNLISSWFKSNIEYKNNQLTSDHSAVGLYKNKTAVCQGIAAYAYLLLSYSGLQARYVSGEGDGANGWGPHGWNMVCLKGNWHHVDYTFELNSRSKEVIKRECEFRRNHRWEESRYSNEQSNAVISARNTLNSSVVILMPGSSCISVNGCLVDTSALHPICQIMNTQVIISLLDIINIYGGCYNLNGSALRVYIGVNSYDVPLSELMYRNKTWYIRALWMKKLHFSMRVEHDAIVLQNMNTKYIEDK